MVRRFTDRGTGDSDYVNERLIRPGRSHVPPVYALHADDRAPGEALPEPWRSCYACPGWAVVTLRLMATYRHPEWPAYVAATTHERQACRHHGDALLAATPGRWHEVRSRTLPD